MFGKVNKAKKINNKLQILLGEEGRVISKGDIKSATSFLNKVEQEIHNINYEWAGCDEVLNSSAMKDLHNLKNRVQRFINNHSGGELM